MTVTPIVSAEDAWIAWALAQSDITAIFSDRIGTRLPVPAYASWPRIRVRRVSGVADQYYRDLPRVQVECWGQIVDEDHPTAETDMDLAARTIAACVPNAAGWVGRIAGMEVAYGPISLPDPDTNRSRYLLDVQFAAH